MVFDKEGAGGILALPSTATTLSIGTGGGCLTGYIDELRFRPGVQDVTTFMRIVPNGMTIVVR